MLFYKHTFFFAVPNYEIVQIHSVRHKRSASSPQEDIHRVNLETHGRQLRLELRPNLHLVPQTRHLDLWYADAFPTNVSYSPVEKVRHFALLKVVTLPKNIFLKKKLNLNFFFLIGHCDVQFSKCIVGVKKVYTNMCCDIMNII